MANVIGRVTDTRTWYVYTETSECVEFDSVINARRMRTRVTVLSLCVCVCVCVTSLLAPYQVYTTRSAWRQ